MGVCALTGKLNTSLFHGWEKWHWNRMFSYICMYVHCFFKLFPTIQRIDIYIVTAFRGPKSNRKSIH